VADSGQLYEGHLDGGLWSWTIKDQLDDGRLLTADETGTAESLRAIAVDAKGQGFAVGDRGVILASDGHGWTRMREGYLDNLASITLAPGGAAHGALVGGEDGLILTLREGRFQIARPADFWDPVAGQDFNLHPRSRIAGVAITPGYADGQVEAWAVQQTPPGSGHRSPDPGRLLHYTNAPEEPLLRAGDRADTLPDAPARRPGELALAAFGKADCVPRSVNPICVEPTGTGYTNEVQLLADRAAVAARAARDPSVAAAVFTGDAGLGAGIGPSDRTIGLRAIGCTTTSTSCSPPSTRRCRSTPRWGASTCPTRGNAAPRGAPARATRAPASPSGGAKRSPARRRHGAPAPCPEATATSPTPRFPVPRTGRPWPRPMRREAPARTMRSTSSEAASLCCGLSSSTRRFVR
jgi:hypothetical protein